MSVYTVLAESLRYPAPGRLEALEHAASALSGEARKRYAIFLEGVRQLSLAEWEELYTHTWDLNPLAAPYVGYQTWGENYQRGNFMAALNRALLDAGVDADGELPDHLIPVLRYLAAGSDPLPELLAILPAALQRIASALKKAAPRNPYVALMECIIGHLKFENHLNDQEYSHASN